MKKNILLLSVLLVFNMQAQKKEAFKIFKANGKKTSYKKLLKTAKKADVVFLVKNMIIR